VFLPCRARFGHPWVFPLKVRRKWAQTSPIDLRTQLGQVGFLVHPIAFHFGPLTVTWYGVMVATAFLAGLWTASRRGLLTGVSSEKVLDLGPWLIIGAILGARTLYVLSYWQQQFAGKPFTEVFKVWQGGLVYYGGLIGATVAGILYARLKKIPVWKLGDVIAPSIALGYVFGRIGCLMN